jgi:hypothetical protein
MTRAEGTIKIDGVEVGELKFDSIHSPTPVLSVTYAFTNSKTGDRYGSGHRNVGWSPKTLEALSALVAAIETDVCTDLFEESATISGVAQAPPDPIDGIPSL